MKMMKKLNGEREERQRYLYASMERAWNTIAPVCGSVLLHVNDVFCLVGFELGYIIKISKIKSDH